MTAEGVTGDGAASCGAISDGFASDGVVPSSMTRVTVRLFAAAADAAGTEETTVDAGGGASRGGATVGAVIDLLAATYGGELRRVLDRCSFLLDGERVGPEVPISGGETLDVLPPFAGG